LTGIAVYICKNFAIQYFANFVCAVTKVFTVHIAFLLFDSHGLGISLFNTNNAIVGRIDAVIIIRSLLIGTTGSHKDGTDHQYSGGSKIIVE